MPTRTSLAEAITVQTVVTSQRRTACETLRSSFDDHPELHEWSAGEEMPDDDLNAVLPPLPLPVPFKPAPQSVIEFVRRLAEIDNVKCVVVEEIETGVMHVTTFAAAMTDADRDAVYEMEVEVIERHGSGFDFHLRRAEEAGETPAMTPGRHFFAIWGGLDASSR